MAQVLQKPVFVLPGCQRMSVNTLLCDILGLAEHSVVPQYEKLEPEHIRQNRPFTKPPFCFFSKNYWPKWPNRYRNPVAAHCRATLCRIAFSNVRRGVAPEAPTVSALKGVSHFKSPLGRCHGTGGCRSYTATLSPVALQWATLSMATRQQMNANEHKITQINAKRCKITESNADWQ